MSYRILIVEDTPDLLEAISVFYREEVAGSRGAYSGIFTDIICSSGLRNKAYLIEVDGDV